MDSATEVLLLELCLVILGCVMISSSNKVPSGIGLGHCVGQTKLLAPCTAVYNHWPLGGGGAHAPGHIARFLFQMTCILNVDILVDIYTLVSQYIYTPESMIFNRPAYLWLLKICMNVFHSSTNSMGQLKLTTG